MPIEKHESSSPSEPICSRCLRGRSSHGPGAKDADCPDGFVLREGEGQGDTARWDSVVLRLTEILGDLALLGAACTGAGEVTAQIHEAAAHVARAAALALPWSKYGAPGSERGPSL